MGVMLAIPGWAFIVNVDGWEAGLRIYKDAKSTQGPKRRIIARERVSLVSHLGAATRKALQGWPTWARRGGTLNGKPIPTGERESFEVLYRLVANRAKVRI